jgi:Secretion system C-terminal sorting domain
MELSDPMGEWRIGDPNPGKIAEVSNPGDAGSTPEIGSVGNDFTDNEILLSPNPADQDIKIQFNIDGNYDFTIRIVDVNGSEVRTISQTNSNLNNKSVAWDRRDSRGNLVTVGVYFIYFRVGVREAIRKVIVM